jgi:hypothetical protein
MRLRFLALRRPTTSVGSEIREVARAAQQEFVVGHS